MGFKITWDVPRILAELRQCAAQVSSPYNDGFSAWHCKQDLLQVKYALDQMLQDLPHFEDEDEWIEQQQKQQVWQILNHKGKK